MDSKENLELNWRQVTCKRSVGGAAFPQGVQDFDFSVSGKNAWIPGYSYFRVEAELNMIDGNGLAVQPAVSDQIAFADSMASCLYNNCYFRAGGQDVSTITQYVPQAHILKNRLDTSGAWMKYIGRDAWGLDSDFSRRLNKVSSNGLYHEDGLSNSVVPTNVNLQYSNVQVRNSAGTALVYGVDGAAAYTAATGIITFTSLGAGIPSYDGSDLQVGDIIRFPSEAGEPSFKIVSRVSDTVAIVSVYNNPGNSRDFADISATPFFAVSRPSDKRNAKNSIFVLFQPPIGIFDKYTGLGSGDFKIQLNPNSNYKTACVEATSNLTPGTDYNINITDVQFYVCQIKKDMPSSGTVEFSLMENQLINKVLAAGTNSQQLDFTVPPSTYALTIFVQSNSAGNDTRIPPTRFKTLGREDENLQQIQVTYGSVTKPSTLYQSEYTITPGEPTGNDNKNQMIQRWVSSQYHSNKMLNEGGCESLDEYLDRGAYYHFDFSRDKNDTSTYVNVFIKYGSSLPADTQLFVVAHYTKMVQMQYEQGYITQVVSVNR